MNPVERADRFEADRLDDLVTTHFCAGCSGVTARTLATHRALAKLAR